MNKIIPKIILLFVFLLTTNVLGQTTLRGLITDSLSGETLYGANVFLKGTALGASSDIEGQYTIKNIPAGTFVVKVSYIGYKDREFNLTFSKEGTRTFNIKLAPDVITGREIVVEGQALGQASAINQQRSSNTIINVVSEEKIKELPDANAAEAIGRLPGVSIIRSGGEANKVILRGLDAQFTNITIDGVKVPATDATSRGVDLSTFSQSTLAGIELYKALTPDKDGDALAGSINMVTKKAPENREIKIDVKGDYNQLMKSAKQYDASLHYGERFLNSFLGVQVTGNSEQRLRSNERINLNYADLDKKEDVYYINDFLLEFTDETRTRNGASLLLDFNTPDDGTIKINNVYNETKRDYLFSTRDYTVNGGGNQGGNPSYDYRDRTQKIKTFNSSIRGNNYLLGLKAEWGISFAQSDGNFPFDYEAIFVETNGMNAPSTFYKTHPEYIIPLAVNNYKAATLNWGYYRTQDNLDKEKTANLDISKQYIFGSSISGEVKLGGKYKSKDRINARDEYLTPYYNGKWKDYEFAPDGSIRKKDFTGTYFEEYLKAGGGGIGIDQFLSDMNSSRNVYDSYRLNPLINKAKLEQWYELNKNGVDKTGHEVELWYNPLIKYDDYNITERVAATYLMNTLNFGQQLTIIAGLRIESENNDYGSKYMTGSAGGFPVTAELKDTSYNYKQTILLPNLNVSFKPFEFMNLRVAAYKALSRPDFNMRLERYVAGRPAEVGSQPQVFVGNSNLKTAQAWNYEINTSFYGNDFGLISISAYYKEIKDMFHMLNNFNTTTTKDSILQFFNIKWPSKMGDAPYNLTLPYNSPKPTKVWGFEFEHQMNFSFLPGLLRNFVLSYNASIVRSEAYLYSAKTEKYMYDPPGPMPPVLKSKNVLVEVKQKLEGMPDFFGNIALGYDYNGFSGRISLFHKGKHNVSFTATGISDVVQKEFTRIDLSLKQRFFNYLSLILNINNLTNVEEGTIIRNRVEDQTRNIFDQSEKYGLTADFGVSIEL